MSVIGRRAEGVARHSRRRPARDAGIETASKRHQNENGRRGARQTADEPHVFVSVGFCLSGIR
ncbi:hypothetical protein ACGY1B_10605, partial [Burkholderia pseudomallei]